jgi:hypothetical protein
MIWVPQVILGILKLSDAKEEVDWGERKFDIMSSNETCKHHPYTVHCFIYINCVQCKPNFRLQLLVG